MAMGIQLAIFKYRAFAIRDENFMLNLHSNGYIK